METIFAEYGIRIEIIAVLMVWFSWSFVGALCGWGWGMISVPFMMLIGFGPVEAIASIAWASFGHSLWWVTKFLRSWYHIPKERWFRILCVMGIIWWVLWIQLLVSIDEALLQKIVGVLLLLLLPVVLYKKGETALSETPSQTKKITWYGIFLLIWVYITFFGPNSGFFVVYGLLYFFWQDIIRSHFLSTVFFLAIQIIALPILIIWGIVSLPVIITLFVWMFIGSYAWVHCMLKLDPVRVRRLMAIMVTIIAAKILFF